MVTHRPAVLAAAALIAATVGAALLHAAPAASTPTHTLVRKATPVQAATATATPANPLTIAAMRARGYPASVLTEVRGDGDQGGYVNTVVSFVADGLTEFALMSTPDRPRPANGWPVIVICHGYIDPRTYRTDDASYGEFIAAFARAGYLVLKPDYRGHGRSQGIAEGGYLSPAYTYDVLDLISTLRADWRVDGSRIGLFGHSLGGYEALRAMVVASGIRAVAFMAGVVGSLDDIFYHWPPPPEPAAPPPAVQEQVARSVIAANGTPQTEPVFWEMASAINFVAESDAAVQIDMDVGDSQVPKLFSDHLDAALVAAGKDVRYILYPGDDHQFTRNRSAVLTNLVAFYLAHL